MHAADCGGGLGACAACQADVAVVPSVWSVSAGAWRAQAGEGSNDAGGPGRRFQPGSRARRAHSAQPTPAGRPASAAPGAAQAARPPPLPPPRSRVAAAGCALLYLFAGERHLPGGLHRCQAQVCAVHQPQRGPLPEAPLPQGPVPHRGEVRTGGGAAAASHSNDGKSSSRSRAAALQGNSSFPVRTGISWLRIPERVQAGRQQALAIPPLLHSPPAIAALRPPRPLPRPPARPPAAG